MPILKWTKHWRQRKQLHEVNTAHILQAWWYYQCVRGLGPRAMRRRRRHFADAAAADRNWSARRRRRPNVGVAPAPFSWRVYVMLYTSYMLLDFSNAVYNEAWTLTGTTRACFAIALDTQTKYGGVKAKVFSWTVLWKWKLLLKVSYGNSLAIGLIKRMVLWKISTACTVGLITAYEVVI